MWLIMFGIYDIKNKSFRRYSDNPNKNIQFELEIIACAYLSMFYGEGFEVRKNTSLSEL